MLLVSSYLSLSTWTLLLGTVQYSTVPCNRSHGPPLRHPEAFHTATIHRVINRNTSGTTNLMATTMFVVMSFVHPSQNTHHMQALCKTPHAAEALPAQSDALVYCAIARRLPPTITFLLNIASFHWLLKTARHTTSPTASLPHPPIHSHIQHVASQPPARRSPLPPHPSRSSHPSLTPRVCSLNRHPATQHIRSGALLSLRV